MELLKHTSIIVMFLLLTSGLVSADSLEVANVTIYLVGLCKQSYIPEDGLDYGALDTDTPPCSRYSLPENMTSKLNNSISSWNNTIPESFKKGYNIILSPCGGDNFIFKNRNPEMKIVYDGMWLVAIRELNTNWDDLNQMRQIILPPLAEMESIIQEEIENTLGCSYTKKIAIIHIHNYIPKKIHEGDVNERGLIESNFSSEFYDFLKIDNIHFTPPDRYVIYKESTIPERRYPRPRYGDEILILSTRHNLISEGGAWGSATDILSYLDWIRECERFRGKLQLSSHEKLRWDVTSEINRDKGDLKKNFNDLLQDLRLSNLSKDNKLVKLIKFNAFLEQLHLNKLQGEYKNNLDEKDAFLKALNYVLNESDLKNPAYAILSPVLIRYYDIFSDCNEEAWGEYNSLEESYNSKRNFIIQERQFLESTYRFEIQTEQMQQQIVDQRRHFTFGFVIALATIIMSIMLLMVENSTERYGYTSFRLFTSDILTKFLIILLSLIFLVPLIDWLIKVPVELYSTGSIILLLALIIHVLRFIRPEEILDKCSNDEEGLSIIKATILRSLSNNDVDVHKTFLNEFFNRADKYLEEWKSVRINREYITGWESEELRNEKEEEGARIFEAINDLANYGVKMSSEDSKRLNELRRELEEKEGYTEGELLKREEFKYAKKDEGSEAKITAKRRIEIMHFYDGYKEKIDEVVENINKEYEKLSDIHEFSSLADYSENMTQEFTQIGVRYLIENKWFVNPKYAGMDIFGDNIGEIIARSEKKNFIKQIKENYEGQIISTHSISSLKREIDKLQFTPTDIFLPLDKYFSDIHKLIDTGEAKYENYKLWILSEDYKIRVHWLTDDMKFKNILVLNNKATKWIRKKYKDMKEIKSIENYVHLSDSEDYMAASVGITEEKPSHLEVYARTVSYLEFVNTDKIKIFKVEE